MQCGLQHPHPGSQLVPEGCRLRGGVASCVTRTATATINRAAICKILQQRSLTKCHKLSRVFNKASTLSSVVVLHADPVELIFVRWGRPTRQPQPGASGKGLNVTSQLIHRFFKQVTWFPTILKRNKNKNSFRQKLEMLAKQQQTLFSDKVASHGRMYNQYAVITLGIRSSACQQVSVQHSGYC